MQIVAVAEKDAAVVVVDQEAQLVRDRNPDLAHPVQAVELADERLEHLHVRDRAEVLAPHVRLSRPLARELVEQDDLALSARLRRHHRRLGAGDELARVRSVLRPMRDPDRDRDRTCEIELDLVQAPGEPGRERHRLLLLAARGDHGELLAADPADDVGRAHRGAQVVGELRQHEVADPVAVDVVHLLEVVDVEHHDGHRRVLDRCLRELAPEPLVEGAVVEEPGERVRLSLVLEALANVRVVERERRRVAEALGELELLLAERGVVADPVDVERPLEQAARDHRDHDQRLRLDGCPRDEPHERMEVRLVREHRLPLLDGPAGDPLAVGEALAQDLVRPLAAHEQGHELAPHLIRLVDVQGLVGDQLGQGVGDPVEQRVEALLRDEIVVDVREAAVRVDEPVLGRDRAPVGRDRVGRNQPDQLAGAVEV